jgi:hypothetical protein
MKHIQERGERRRALTRCLNHQGAGGFDADAGEAILRYRR